MNESHDHSSRLLRPPRLKKTTSFRARGSKQDIPTSPPIIKAYLADDEDEQHNFSTCNWGCIPLAHLRFGTRLSINSSETVPAPAVEMERGKVGKEDTKR